MKIWPKWKAQLAADINSFWFGFTHPFSTSSQRLAHAETTTEEYMTRVYGERWWEEALDVSAGDDRP